MPRNRKLNRSRYLADVSGDQELRSGKSYPVRYSLLECTVTCHFVEVSRIEMSEKGAD